MENIIKLEKNLKELEEFLPYCNDLSYSTYFNEIKIKERELMELELLQLFKESKIKEVL